MMSAKVGPASPRDRLAPRISLSRRATRFEILTKSSRARGSCGDNSRLHVCSSVNLRPASSRRPARIGRAELGNEHVDDIAITTAALCACRRHRACADYSSARRSFFERRHRRMRLRAQKPPRLLPQRCPKYCAHQPFWARHAACLIWYHWINVAESSANSSCITWVIIVALAQRDVLLAQREKIRDLERLMRMAHIPSREPLPRSVSPPRSSLII